MTSKEKSHGSETQVHSDSTGESEKRTEEEESGSMWKKLLRVVGLIKLTTVEPAALLMMTAVLASFLQFQNSMMENICRVYYNYTQETCQAVLNAQEGVEDETANIQKIYAELQIYKSIIDNTFPILYVLFVGPLSDHYGRKVPLVLPIIGFGSQVALYMVLTPYLDTVNPYLYATVTSLPRSLCGGELAFSMAAYSLIADITTHSSRTVRCGILQAAYLAGVPLGFSIGGQMFKAQLGYAKSYAICLGIHVAALLSVIFLVTNTSKRDRLRMEREKSGVKKEKDEEVEEDLNCMSVLNPRANVYEVLLVGVKKREGNGRLMIILLLIAYLCSAAPMHGEFAMYFPYVMAKLRWSATEYSYFQSFNTITRVVGVIVSMGLLSKLLRLSDPFVGFITGFSQMGGSLIYAAATSGLLMYIGAAVDMMNGAMVVAARSMLTKIVKADEMGKLFALIAVLETCLPLAMNPSYNGIYRSLLENGRNLGWVFVLSAALAVPAQIIFLSLTIKGGTRLKSDKDNSEKDPTSENKNAIEDCSTASDGEGVRNQAFDSTTESDSR